MEVGDRAVFSNDDVLLMQRPLKIQIYGNEWIFLDGAQCLINKQILTYTSCVMLCNDVNLYSKTFYYSFYGYTWNVETNRIIPAVS